MKIVDRMMWRELVGPVATSAMMFLMLLFSSAYLMKLTDMMMQGASLWLVSRVALYSLPLLITQTLPMGLLLGTILAIGRLSGDSEHIALFATGISFYRIARPVGYLGFIVGLLAIAWNETVVPPATQEFYKLSQNVVENIKATANPLQYTIKKPGTESVDEVVLIDGGFDSRTRSLRRVTMLKMSEEKPGLPEVMVYADVVQARDAKGTDWDFYDAYVRYLRPVPEGQPTADVYMKHTRTLPRNVRIGKDFRGVMASDVQDNRRLSFMELREKIREKRKEADPSAMGDEFDLWAKLSLPLASLIFGLVAAPLGVRPQRSGKTVGFGIAIGIIFVYYVVHQGMYQVGKSGGVHPFIAAFTADFFGLIAAIFLMARTRQ